MNSKERIIEFVRNHPSLYDKKLEEYKDLNAKYKVWKELALILNMNVEKVQTVWKCLRDSYNRCKKMKRQGGWRIDPEKKWHYFKYMKFLDDIKLRNYNHFEDSSTKEDSNAIEGVNFDEVECDTSELITPKIQLKTENERYSQRSPTHLTGDIARSVQIISDQVHELVGVCRTGFMRQAQKSASDNTDFFNFIGRKAEKNLSPTDLTNFQSEVHSLLNRYIVQQQDDQNSESFKIE